MECMRNQFVEGVVLDGRFQTISPLNHGSFGMVFMARDLYTGEPVALKCLTKTQATNNCPMVLAFDDRSEELAIHTRIGSHPHIVNLVHSFETENHFYLVLEFCANGDLYEAIRLGKGPLETEHVRDFMLQLVNAVEHMHANGIYHRDIKPENIFLTQSGSMKLGDFGLATTEDVSYESAVGSDRYMAPEQYDATESGYSPAKADVWAIGICLLNVLFSRNPFAVPNTSDPLFADFAGDRQSLFDVFPNMSQDTYEVLVHSLALDPSRRSLSAVRGALMRVISFTIDDETLDEFCTEDRDPVIASANREPLRTPSITSPQPDTGSFPWAKALALSPQPQLRQLSAIPDTEVYAEESLPSSARSSQEWYSVKPDNASDFSFADSGLGVSLDSTASTQPIPTPAPRAKPTPIVGSLPINISRPFPNISFAFGKKRDAVSKSWSDLWDEEEEELALSETENTVVETKPSATEKWTRGSESGLSTPRAGLVEVKNPEIVHNSRNRSPAVQPVRIDHRVSEQTGFIFEDHSNQPRFSPLSKRSIIDKWAALGDRRRGAAAQQKPTHAPPQRQQQPRKRNRTSSWRRQVGWGSSHNNDSGVWERKDWSLSKDWRQHPNNLNDDIGDLEWVGGWNDLHL